MSRQVQPTSGALRAANRSTVVRVLRQSGWVTRSQIVVVTGLSRATVSSVLSELMRDGLVAERPTASGGASGRPATQVGLNTAAGTAIAVDIGVRHVAVAVGDLSHSVLSERWVTTPRDHTAARGTRIVMRSIEEAVDQAGIDPDQLVGAALSIAAPVAAHSGSLAVPGVLPGWNGSTLASAVAQRWGIPVVTENDANLGALGDAIARPPDGDGDVVYVKIASRIGLGIVRDQRIVRGRHGFAGELGHVPARVGGDRCWCGRQGCLELYAGGDGMLRRLAASTNADANGVSSIPDLIRSAAGNASVRRVVNDGVTLLARALAGVAVMLDPARIVLGGELTGLGDLLEQPIRRELRQLPFTSPTELAVTPLGHRASLVGALSLVLTEPGRFGDYTQDNVRPTSSPESGQYPRSPLAGDLI